MKKSKQIELATSMLLVIQKELGGKLFAKLLSEHFDMHRPDALEKVNKEIRKNTKESELDDMTEPELRKLIAEHLQMLATTAACLIEVTAEPFHLASFNTGLELLENLVKVN